MALLASEVLDRVASVYMNDPNKLTYTDDKMLPKLKAAWDDLQLQMLLIDARVFAEETASPASVTSLARTIASPPADMIFPLALDERIPGQTDADWVPMRQQKWDDSDVPGPDLIYWIYREDAIQFLGATQTKQVRIRYMKFLNPITGSNSSVAIVLANAFLAPRTAALLSGFAGGNVTRATACNQEADVALEALKTIYIKQMQETPAIRRSEYFQ